MLCFYRGRSTVSVASYTYSCAQDNRATHTPGILVPNLLCSTYSGCPSLHRTNMGQMGVPCGPNSRISLCPCE